MFAMFLARTFGFILPGFLADVAVDFVKGIYWLVGQLHTVKEATGPEKLARAVALGREFADEYLDAIPAWKELDEDRRDRILSGIVESVLLLEQLHLTADDLRKEGPDSGDARRARRRALVKLQESRVTAGAAVDEPTIVKDPVDEPEVPRTSAGKRRRAKASK